MQGRIYKGIGGFYYVKTTSGVVECRARGRFRKDSTVPMVGDYVEVDIRPDSAYLVEIEPRRSQFKRPPVANLDVLAIVASAAPPVTDRFLIDRMIAVALYKNVKPLILLNKSDICPAEDLLKIYTDAGLDALLISAESGEGCARFADIIGGKTVAFSGVSGVGKSSLLNRVFPDADAQTGGLQVIGRGRHTTRHVELFDLPNGAVLADTPGFSAFDDENETRIPHVELEQYFPEFAPHLGACRFVGCAHVKDKDCAVLAALDRGEVAASRHQSYCKMYAAAKDFNPYK